MSDATKLHFLMLALLFVVAAFPACVQKMYCAPCPACNPEVVAAPPTLWKDEPVAAPPIMKEEVADAGPAAQTVTAAPAAEPMTAAIHQVPKPEPALSGGRVRNAKEYFATLKNRFVSGAAKDVHAVFQFDLSGPDAVAYHVAVDDGTMRLEKGHVEKANVTIASSTENYVKVVNGELGGVGAVLSRKMKVGGDLTLARKMKQIFPGGHAD